jgi:hypothetical protein
VTIADLINFGIQLFRADGSTAGVNPLVAMRGFAAVLPGGANVHSVQQYDVRGIPKVRVVGTNANAASKIMVCTVCLGSEV